MLGSGLGLGSCEQLIFNKKERKRGKRKRIYDVHLFYLVM